MDIPESELPEAQALVETAKTLTAIEETGRRATGAAPGLPHPFETDQNLGRFLSAGTVAADGGGRPGLAGRLGRQLLIRLLPSQVAYNEALINVIHQLDHRGRQQREEIADLQQGLAALSDQLPREHQ